MIGSGQWPHLFPCSYHPLFFAQIKISNSINFSWAVTHKTTTESMILAKLPLWNKNYAKIWCMPYWSWNFVWWLLRWDNIFCCPHPNWLIKLEMSQINRSEHNKDDWGPQWTSVDPFACFHRWVHFHSTIDPHCLLSPTALDQLTLSTPTLIIQTHLTSLFLIHGPGWTSCHRHCPEQGLLMKSSELSFVRIWSRTVALKNSHKFDLKPYIE